MIDLEKTKHHRVYRTEVLGDTMVVTLLGDAAGFSISAVHNEMVTLVGIARQPKIKHLIIDMSGGNYYGSTILGEIVNLGQAIREKSGRIALAGISPDMKEILRIMRLEEMWELFPTLPKALRAMATIPWRVRMRPYWKPVGIAVAIALLIGLYIFIPRPDYTPGYLAEVSQVWREGEQLRAADVSDTEWALYTKPAKEKLADVTRVLKKYAGTDRPAAQYVLYAARDHAPLAIDQRLQPDLADTRLAAYFLALAKAELEKTPVPPPPKELAGAHAPTLAPVLINPAAVQPPPP